MFIHIYMYYTTTCMSPCVNNVLTLLCEHPSTNCFFKSIVPCMSMHNASLSTSTSTLPLAYHHVSPSVNTAVWTLLCEHASTNCFFKCIVPCMCMYKASLSTYTSTTLPLAYHHMLPSLNIVWRLMSNRQCKIDVNAYLNCLQSDCFQIFSNWRHGSARHNGNMWVTYEYMRN